MNIGSESYKKYADAHAPKSRVVRDSLMAFLIGGLICAVAEALNHLWSALGMSSDDGGLLTSVVLIFTAAVLTAFGVFDDIAKVAGAGTLVPITGFANSVVSPAMEYRSEGLVTGMAAKMFTIAGPVIVYGTVASVLYGVIYWLCTAL